MKSSYLCTLLLILSATYSVARAETSGRTALPAAPAPSLAGASAQERPIPPDAATPEEANTRKRHEIQQRIKELATRIKRLDRNPTGLTSEIGEGSKPSLESVAPSVGREQLAEELESWKRFAAAFDLETICGPLDDSQDVEMYDGTGGPSKQFVARHQAAVAQIQWVTDIASRIGAGADSGNVSGARWCTGTLISASRLLTAGHCFDISRKGWITPLRHGNPVSPAEIATLMQINFNYQLDPASMKPRTPSIFPIVRLLEHRLGGLDYAIVDIGKGVDGSLPSERFPPAQVSTSRASLDNAKFLTLIQHPNGVPKRVAGGRSFGVDLPLLNYSDIDTLGGSSGSGVLDQSGNVIAVHTLGGCTETGGSNSGVTLFSIANVSQALK